MDSEESDFYVWVENNDLFDMYCDLRYVLSDFFDLNVDKVLMS